MAEATAGARVSLDPLFRPLTIRGMKLANRIVMAPMTRGFSPEGTPGQNVADYYRRRIEGGCGLIITEGVAVDHPAAMGDAGLDEKDVPYLAGDEPMAGWRRVCDDVHAAGGRIACQLWHQGVLRKQGTGPFPHVPTVSPSGLWGPLGRISSVSADSIPPDPKVGEAMTGEDIEAVIDAFARCARNAVEVGFDAIALHGAHGYLIDNFLWEGTNLRDDQWGGDHRRRTAFAVEIVRRIRAEVGPDLPIFFRFSQWKQQDFKARLAETPDELAKLLCPMADAGVDVFDASVRYYNTPAFEGSPLTLAGWAQKVTGKIAMAVGGIGINRGVYDTSAVTVEPINLDPLMQRMGTGEFELAAVGRAMLGDAQWANKVREGVTPRPFEPDDQHRLT